MFPLWAHLKGGQETLSYKIEDMVGVGVSAFTCYIIPYSNGREGDDYKVNGLQRSPSLIVFEDKCWESDED